MVKPLKISPDKIGDSKSAFVQLLGTVVIAWITIYIVVYAIKHILLAILLIFETTYDLPIFLPATIILAVLLKMQFDRISVDVPMNKCFILLDFNSGNARAVFAGFHFKLPWEKEQYKVDLEIPIHSDITETFPTKDGSMKATASVMSKIDSGDDNTPEYDRSVKMVKFVKFERKTIEGMQDAIAKKSMREVFANKNSEDVKKSKSDDILKKADFKDLEDTIAITVIKCAVKDVDYNDETQKSLNDIFKAETLAKMVNLLIKDKLYTEDEAKAIVPFLHKDIAFKKQINEITANVNGLSLSPEILELVSSIAKKIGGTK